MEDAVIIADTSGKGFDFARGVYEYLRNKRGREFPVLISDIRKTRFKDGEFKLKISENIRRKKCFFIHDPNKDASEWVADLIFGLDAIAFSSPSEVNVVFPYTKFARQDRKDQSRTSVNIKAIADVVSRRATRGLTVDLHTPQIQEYFDIPFDNLYSQPVLISYLQRQYKDFLEDLVVVSPDAGGAKRAEGLKKQFGKMGVDAGLAVGYKQRLKDNHVETLKIMGDVSGKNCLVVDDIIDTGGTLTKTAEALKSGGARKVFAYGTHGLFSSGKLNNSALDGVLTSDTVVSSGEAEVVSMIPLFGEAIFRTIVGKSLSILFERPYDSDVSGFL